MNKFWGLLSLIPRGRVSVIAGLFSLMAMLCAIFVLVSPSVWAEEAAKQQNAPLLQLGVGDELKFDVFGQQDMSSTLYVADDGTVTIPLAGAVKIEGLSPTQAASKLEQALVAGNYLVNPHVSLTVTQTRSQRVSVLGEVRSPGRYTIDSNTTIFDLLAQAGGVNPDGADSIYILRPGANGAIERYSVNLQGLSNDKFKLPVDTLKSGDSVYVPRAQQFYIFGEINKPGMFSLEPQMTVLQAVAKAGGINQRGSMHRIEIKRRVGEKKYRTFSADLTDLVEADDVIQIKESIF
jgi:polysaccharide biosynthesis/export protein